MKKLLLLLADPLQVFYDKGEIKPRYYNPDNLFSEVHFVSPARREISADRMQTLVGDAKMVVYPLGRGYGVSGWLPVGPLAAVMRLVSPDVIRAYDPGIRGCLAVRWGRRLGVPSVVSLHGDLPFQYLRETPWVRCLRLAMARCAFRGADVTVCVSRYLAGVARRYGARRIEVIYNRVDTTRLVSGNRCWVVGGGAMRRPVVLSVGRLVEPKDPECLVRAIRHVPVTLRLIGEGPLRKRLQRIAEECGVSDRVELVGAVPHADIHQYYLDADIFAIATRSEGFCIPVLEAMAAGLPVVASRLDSIEEVLGGSGDLVDHAPEAFAAAFARLVGDSALCRSMGEQGRARAITLDGQFMEEQEAGLYRSLLS